MYYRLDEKQLEILNKVQKLIPLNYKIYGDFISCEDLFTMLEDLYYEYMNFVELATE